MPSWQRGALVLLLLISTLATAVLCSLAWARLFCLEFSPLSYLIPRALLDMLLEEKREVLFLRLGVAAQISLWSLVQLYLLSKKGRIEEGQRDTG